MIKPATYFNQVPSKIAKKDWGTTARNPMAAASQKKMIWIESPSFMGWSCSACAWVFNPSWPFAGKSIDEMKTEFEQHRDKEFASHVCAKLPRATKISR